MYSLPLRTLGHQLAIDSVFIYYGNKYIVVGVVCKGSERLGVSFIPYAIRNNYTSDSRKYLSDEKYLTIHDKITLE